MEQRRGRRRFGAGANKKKDKERAESEVEISRRYSRDCMENLKVAPASLIYPKQLEKKSMPPGYHGVRWDPEVWWNSEMSKNPPQPVQVAPGGKGTFRQHWDKDGHLGLRRNRPSALPPVPSSPASVHSNSPHHSPSKQRVPPSMLPSSPGPMCSPSSLNAAFAHAAMARAYLMQSNGLIFPSLPAPFTPPLWTVPQTGSVWNPGPCWGTNSFPPEKKKISAASSPVGTPKNLSVIKQSPGRKANGGKTPKGKGAPNSVQDSPTKAGKKPDKDTKRGQVPTASLSAADKKTNMEKAHEIVSGGPSASVKAASRALDLEEKEAKIRRLGREMAQFVLQERQQLGAWIFKETKPAYSP